MMVLIVLKKIKKFTWRKKQNKKQQLHLALLLIWWINAQIPLLKSAALQDFNRYFLTWTGFTLTCVRAAFVLAVLLYKKHDLELKSLSHVCMLPLSWQCYYVKSMTLNWNHCHNNSPTFLSHLDFRPWHGLVLGALSCDLCHADMFLGGKKKKEALSFVFILSLVCRVELPPRQASFKIKFYCGQK